MKSSWNNVFFTYKKDDLERYLQTHDVNKKDSLGCYVESIFRSLPSKKLDILFKHGYRPYKKGINYLFWPSIDESEQSLLVARKLLEHDTEGLYVRMKQYPGPAWSLGECGTKLEEFEAHLKLRHDGRSLIIVYYVNIDHVHNHYELLKSHKNRHFTMFEHFIHFLGKKDFNKKQQL